MWYHHGNLTVFNCMVVSKTDQVPKSRDIKQPINLYYRIYGGAVGVLATYSESSGIATGSISVS